MIFFTETAYFFVPQASCPGPLTNDDHRKAPQFSHAAPTPVTAALGPTCTTLMTVQ